MALRATPVVQVEFDAGVWTTVPARRARGQRGRSFELDPFQPGTASVVLDNRDRRFDPAYTAGPYYGKLLPRKRIRVGVTYSATTYWQFYGYVNGWPQSYSPPRDATVTISAVDRFKVLARSYLPSVWQQTVEAASPEAWWRQGESSGTDLADASGNKHNGTYEGGATFNSRTGLVFGDRDNGIEYQTGQRGVVPVVTNAYPFSVETWIQVPDYDEAATDPGFIFRFGANHGVGTADDERVYALVDPDDSVGYPRGRIEAAVASGQFEYYWVYSSVGVLDGQPHHVVVTASAWNNLKVYVDGVDRTVLRATAGTVTTPPFTGTANAGLGNRNAGSTTFSADRGIETDDFPLKGTLDEVVVHNTALSAETVAAHYAAGAAPWENDTPKARLDRIADYLGIAAGERDFDTGSAALLPATLETNALAHAQAVELTEGGRLFESRNGVLTLVGRQNFWTETVYTTSRATLSDSPGAGEVHYSVKSGDLFDYDDSHIINEARIQPYGGVEQVAVDAGSQTDFDLISHSESSLESRSTVAKNRAEYIVSKYADPLLRCPQIVLEPERNPAVMYPVVLAAELGYRYTLERTPQNVGSQNVVLGNLERIEFDISTKAITFTWGLSPVEPDFGGWDVGLWGSTFKWSY